jgi:hypothetical protein
MASFTCNPRPRPRHARGIGFLGHFLGGSFDYDADGPGGWWIVPEPGIELPRAPEVSPGKWVVEAVFSEEAAARIPPFAALTGSGRKIGLRSRDPARSRWDRGPYRGCW